MALNDLYAQAFTSTNPTTVFLTAPTPYGIPFQAMPTFEATPPVRYPNCTTIPGLLPADELPLKAQMAVERLEAVPMEWEATGAMLSNELSLNIAQNHSQAVMKNLAEPLPS